MIYSFTIQISPPDMDMDKTADKLYEAGCNDALFGMSDGKYYISFDREGESRLDVITSALSDILEAEIGSHVIEVKFED